MDLTQSQIEDIFVPSLNWNLLNKVELAKLGVMDMPNAKVVCGYEVGEISGKTNTATLYDYGSVEQMETVDLLEELKQGYEEIAQSRQLQLQTSIRPMQIEILDDKILFVVLDVNKIKDVKVVDVFFVYNANIYCIHTFIKRAEPQLACKSLMFKYPYIKHIINQLYGK